MSSKLRHIGMFSGMTILGDGAVVMVIDRGVSPNRLLARRCREASVYLA